MNFVTFNDVLREFKALDFNKIIYKNKRVLIFYLSVCSLLPVTSAYFISEVFNDGTMKTITFWSIFIIVGIGSFRFILSPYIKKRGRVLGIPQRKGFYPFDYRSFVLESMIKSLDRLDLNNPSAIRSLIRRANLKAEIVQKSRITVNTNFLMTFLIPLWTIIIAWVFRNYVELAEDPIPRMYEIIKSMVLIPIALWLIYIVLNFVINETLAQPKNKFLGFADILEDLLLNTDKVKNS